MQGQNSSEMVSINAGDNSSPPRNGAAVLDLQERTSKWQTVLLHQNPSITQKGIEDYRDSIHEAQEHIKKHGGPTTVVDTAKEQLRSLKKVIENERKRKKLEEMKQKLWYFKLGAACAGVFLPKEFYLAGRETDYIEIDIDVRVDLDDPDIEEDVHEAAVQ